MKNIFKTLALALSVLFAASCDLSEYNPNEFGPAIAYANEANCQLGINAFYNEFPSVTGAYSKEQGGADYITANQLSARYQAGYSAVGAGEWGGWSTLRKFNYYLMMMNSSACGVSGSVKDNFIAQARFFRAYWYFDMLMTYGDLPWYDKVLQNTDVDEEWKDRDSRDVIIKNMIDDLDFAIKNITATSKDATCLTSTVAQFVKMQVCLFEASFRKYNNVTASVRGKSFSNYSVNELYKLAAEAAEAIISSGEYTLISNYRDLFTSGTLQTDEVILGAQTSATIKGSQNNYYNYVNSNPRSLVRPFINTFLMSDGTPYTTTKASTYSTEMFSSEFEGRDPRLACIVRTPGYVFNGSVAAPQLSIAPTGYQIIKFCLDEYQDDKGTDETSGTNGNSTPIFRYAEVLLDYAEAKAELGEMDNTIWAQTVGAIRKRAGITGSTLTTVPTTVDSYLKTNFYPDVTDPIIMEIRRERACELCLEGQRNSDLLRWGCGALLADEAWTGINISGINTAIDIDGDGSEDAYVYESGQTVPDEYKSIAVEVNNETGVEVAANGSVYQLKYNVASNLRYWAADGHLSLAALSQDMIDEYTARGYTLTQNPGY